MRLSLTLLFTIFLCTCVSAQFVGTSGTWNFSGPPDKDAKAKGPFKAIDIDTGQEYFWNADSAAWLLVVAEGGGAGADIGFDSDRPVLRVPQVGDVIGGSDLLDFATYFYFAEPTLSLSTVPSTTLYEWGTENTVSVNTSTDNPAAVTLGGGKVYASGTQFDQFGADATSSSSFTFSPGAPSGNNATSYSFQATQDWIGGGEFGDLTSNTRSVKGIYPILYGVTSTDLHTTGNPYTALTGAVIDQSDVSRTLSGSGYIYYAFPTTWSVNNLSQIIDGNGFNVTPSFTVQTVSVSSSGLDNDWTQDYRIYKLNTTTTLNDATYQFRD